MSAVFAPLPMVLAWSGSDEDERRFQRILIAVLLAALLFALVMPWLPVAAPDRSVAEPLPPHYAKLLLDREPLPSPPKVDRPKDEPVAPPPDAARAQDRAPIVEARRPQPNKAPGERLDNARARASGVGLLAMKNELASLHAAPAAVQMNQDVKPGPGPGVGTGSGPGVGAGQGPGVPTRSLITSNATGGSGGINTAAYSRDTGGGGLAGRSTTLVEGVAGGRGGGGAGGTRAGSGTGVGSGAGGSVQRGGSGKASRSIEEIRLVFERNKGAIYAIYNRALREEPALQGKVVLELTIAPAGQITGCRIVSSELKAPDLEAKLLARIRQFDFGAKDVEVMTVTWPLDFLPS